MRLTPHATHHTCFPRKVVFVAGTEGERRHSVERQLVLRYAEGGLGALQALHAVSATAGASGASAGAPAGAPASGGESPRGTTTTQRSRVSPLRRR